MSEVVGYSATAAVCLTLVPQIAKTIQTKSGKDISYAMLGLNVTASVLFGVYGVMESKLPLIISGCISTAASFLRLIADGVGGRG